MRSRPANRTESTLLGGYSNEFPHKCRRNMCKATGNVKRGISSGVCLRQNTTSKHQPLSWQQSSNSPLDTIMFWSPGAV